VSRHLGLENNKVTQPCAISFSQTYFYFYTCVALTSTGGYFRRNFEHGYSKRLEKDMFNYKDGCLPLADLIATLKMTLL
jgi:hypothetical protein